MKKISIYLSVFLLISGFAYSQNNEKLITNSYSIEGATAHLGTGEVISNSLIMFENGKITFVGKAEAKIARKGEVIYAKGQHVYPGFIAANTSLGLGEIDAVKATLDYDEVGDMLPHIKSIYAYNAESKVVESMRPNGVLMAQVVPRGGVISGTSSIVQLDAWNWEDATYKKNDGIHINWPPNFTRGRWWLGEDPGKKPNKNYQKSVAKIKTFFTDAKNYTNSSSAPKNIPLEAMEGLFNGTQTLFIHASFENQITDAVETLSDLGINNMVLVHGTEAVKVSELLLKHNIPVILERAHRVPENNDDAYDLPFASAAVLANKGITVAIGMEGSMERMSARNLPFYAGTYAAYGLDKEEALKLITLNSAKILGIESKVGSIEVGKDATLFISEGDALDMRTNKLTKAFIIGQPVSLETHQTKLYKRYKEKYLNQ